VRATYPSLPDLPPPYLASPAETMLLFLDDLRRRHGSVEAYAAAGGLGRDEVEAMRAHLLTD
jgi:hypothetical protein